MESRRIKVFRSLMTDSKSSGSGCILQNLPQKLPHQSGVKIIIELNSYVVCLCTSETTGLAHLLFEAANTILLWI